MSNVVRPRVGTNCGPPVRESVNIIGVGLHPMRYRAAVDLMERWISERLPRIVLFPGSDMLAACQENPRQRAIFNRADLLATDGMMLVRVCRWLGAAHAERVYGPDVMLELCKRSARSKYRHFFYGGAPQVTEKLVARLQGMFPNLPVAGFYSPPFRPLSEVEMSDAIRLINDSGADIVWVGLSTPKQELWIAEARSNLRAPLLLGVGAAFDFHSGTIRQAPPWIRSVGREWLFRLCAEPRRLWRRYTLRLIHFLALLTMQVLGFRQFPIHRDREEVEIAA